MTKLQKILLFLGLGTLVGVGSWYVLKKNKKENSQNANKSLQNANSNSQNENFVTENSQREVLTPALLEYENDEVGTQYRLNFYDSQTNTIKQPIGFERFFNDNRVGSAFTSNGQIVQKVDFLSVDSIRNVWENDKQRVLDFFAKAENKNQYLQNNQLLDSATPDYPMLVQGPNGKLYAVPSIEYAFGNYSKRKLLEKI